MSSPDASLTVPRLFSIVVLVSDPGRTRDEVAATTLLAFAGAVVFAGGNAPAIRYVSCDACELDPFWAASTRFFLAGLLFMLVAAVSKAAMPRGRALLGATLYGVFQFGAGFGLVYWGLVRTQAGLAQVLISCVPLLTLGLAIVHHQESFRWDRLMGGIVSVAGIAIVFGSGLEAGIPVSSMIAIIAGAVCWAEALIVVRRFPPIHPVVLNAVGMAVGGAVLLVASAAFGEAFAIPEMASTWGAQAYLVLAGSMLVFWLYVVVLRRWTATAASYQLVLIPLVTVPVSAWLQEERISFSFVVGAALVLVGVYIGALRSLEVSGAR